MTTNKTPDDLQGPRHWGNYAARTPGAALMLFTQVTMLATWGISYLLGSKVGAINPMAMMELLFSHGADKPLDFVIGGEAMGRGLAPLAGVLLWIGQSLPIAALLVWGLARFAETEAPVMDDDSAPEASGTAAE